MTTASTRVEHDALALFTIFSGQASPYHASVAAAQNHPQAAATMDSIGFSQLEELDCMPLSMLDNYFSRTVCSSQVDDSTSAIFPASAVSAPAIFSAQIGAFLATPSSSDVALHTVASSGVSQGLAAAIAISSAGNSCDSLSAESAGFSKALFWLGSRSQLQESNVLSSLAPCLLAVAHASADDLHQVMAELNCSSPARDALAVVLVNGCALVTRRAYRFSLSCCRPSDFTIAGSPRGIMYVPHRL